MCDECPRARNVKTIKQFTRIQSIKADPALCLLEQGIPCNGPATVGGCGAPCPLGQSCVGGTCTDGDICDVTGASCALATDCC